MKCDWDGPCNRVATKVATFKLSLQAPDVPFPAAVIVRAALCEGHYDTIKGTCKLIELPTVPASDEEVLDAVLGPDSLKQEQTLMTPLEWRHYRNRGIVRS